MNTFNFSSQQEQVTELAKNIAKKIYELLKVQPQVWIAVSGGKSPIGLFSELNKYDLAWDKITITLVDERYVDPQHQDSNENLVRKHLLINNASKADFVGLVTKGSSILDCVGNANLHIRKIDIAILGMGEDGHTASIFPCSKEILNILNTDLTPEKYVITSPTTANYQRIGLSLAGILEIPQLILSINGEKKMQVLDEASQIETPRLPISYVLKRHPNIDVFAHV